MLIDDLYAFDLETFLFRPGLQTPPIVCGSEASVQGARLLPGDQAVDAYRQKLHSTRVVFCGANWAGFDGPVMANAIGPDEVFKAFDQGRVFDVSIAQELEMISRGLHGLARDGSALRAPPPPGQLFGKITNRYSLALVTWQNTGRADAKKNDVYRLRYGEFFGVPVEQWPEEARVYPVDDAVNTLDNARLQVERFNNLGPLQHWGHVNEPLTHMTINTRAVFAIKLAATWGLLTDPVAVEALEARVNAAHDAAVREFQSIGLFKEDGKKDLTAIKRRVILAYSKEPPGPCEKCAGSGKIPSEKTGKPVNCKTCSGTGLHVGPFVPVTDVGGVKTDAPTIEESGDELLDAFADATEDEKIRETYVPFLKRGTRYGINSESAILDTTRHSFGINQTMPRKGGVRECIIPRSGFVMCSVDYGALEFCTLGQVCKRLFGYSTIADAINSDLDSHSILGSDMMQMSYGDFKARVKAADKLIIGVRTAAKAGNFGFGGLMGHAKFVITQRKARIGGHGSMCRLMGREEHPCGSVKITEWNGHTCKPLCDQCLQVTRELKNGWLNRWTEMSDYFNWVKMIPGIDDGQGIICSPGTGFVRGGLKAPEAANHCFQHLAAYGAKHALYHVSKACYTDRRSPLYGSRPVVFAHDEIIAEVPEDCAHEAGEELARVMIEKMREFVPDVKITAEPALMRRWYKEAQTVRDADGRLIPWEPKKEATK